MRSILAWGCALALTAAAQESQIAWQPDFDAALKLAQSEKKPLFIVFLMDNEPANDSVAGSHLHDKGLVELSRSFVCLIASPGKHGDAAACPKFGAGSCAQHAQVEMRARTAYMNSPRVAAPQFLAVAPDGKTVILRHVYVLAASELENKLRIALGGLDPSKGGDAF